MIKLRVLGGVELSNGDEHVLHTLLAQPKRMALLVILTTRSSDGFTRRDTIASLFWPERDQEHARAGLRTALHALRRALGDVFPTRGNDEVGVDPRAIWCDAVEFAAACREGRWQDANDLYRGEFLSGVHVFDASPELERWIEDERTRYRQQATAVAWQLAAIEERRGNATAALERGRQAVSFDPTDELAMRRLLQLHAAIGDRAGAVAAFEAFSQRLRTELEVEPSVETVQLIESIRRGRPVNSGADSASGGSVTSAKNHARHDRRRRWFAGAASAALMLVVLGGAWSRTQKRDAALLTAPASGSVSELAKEAHGFFRLVPMPTPLSHIASAYDAARDKVYVFGGNDGRGHTNDVWEMDSPGAVSGISWTRIEARGRAPRARSAATAVYDSIADRLIIFGGAMGTTSPCANDALMVQNPSRVGGEARWVAIAPVGEGPVPRADHSATWVPRTRRMIVFGGHDCIAERWNDTWVLDFAIGQRPRWRRIAASGRAPSPRAGHATVYDEKQDRILLVGGGTDRHVNSDLWELRAASSDSAEWRELPARGAPRLMHHKAAWDPVGHTLIVFGGAPSESVGNPVWLLQMRDDAGQRWQRLSPPGTPTLPRITHGMAYNASLDELIVFGGLSDGAVLFDAWALMNVSKRRLR